MILNLFLTSSQVHNYGTRTANHYRSHSYRTNLNQFTVLYQGPKIWNSLPISILLHLVFFTFKEKMLQFLSIKSWIGQAAQHHTFYLLMPDEVASLISRVVSWGLLAIIVNWMISYYLIRQINDDDDHDKKCQFIRDTLPAVCIYFVMRERFQIVHTIYTNKKKTANDQEINLDLRRGPQRRGSWSVFFCYLAQ